MAGLGIVNSKSGSNLKIEILKDGKSRSKGGNGEVTKLTWRIDNFSSLEKDQELYSEDFSVDGNKWNIVIDPNGEEDNVDYFSIYLELGDSMALPSGWIELAEFKATESCWGFPSFLALSELHDPKRGYLLNDACLVEAYISTDRTEGLISHEVMVENDSDKHKTKEANHVKAALGNRKTTTTKPVGITTPSPTQPCCQIEAIEPEEPTEEDMNTFFTSLESELLCSDIVYSQEKAKEALSKLIDDALDMTPINFYYSGKFSLLEQAFKIVASFDCSSTTLMIAQQNELMTMGKSLKELAIHASKAVQEKIRLTAKESIKLTIARNLDCNTTRYKEVKSEVKRVEQKLAALLAEQKDIFKSSKAMRMELEAVGKEWAEYEANANAAKEEEKSVEAEWGRMKI
ncbi:hypothetical protein V6N13_014766 [Hibiscus sabdariffa]